MQECVGAGKYVVMKTFKKKELEKECLCHTGRNSKCFFHYT